MASGLSLLRLVTAIGAKRNSMASRAGANSAVSTACSRCWQSWCHFAVSTVEEDRSQWSSKSSKEGTNMPVVR